MKRAFKTSLSCVIVESPPRVVHLGSIPKTFAQRVISEACKAAAHSGENTCWCWLEKFTSYLEPLLVCSALRTRTPYFLNLLAFSSHLHCVPYRAHNTVTKCLGVCSNKAFMSGAMSQFLQGVPCSHLNPSATSYLSNVCENRELGPPPPTQQFSLAIKNAISWTSQLVLLEQTTTHIKSLSLAMALLHTWTTAHQTRNK